MNRESQLKIQAYLDDELNATERKLVENWLKTDPETVNLYQELSLLRQCIKRNEIPHALPVPPDFYWSQIKQQISKPEIAKNDSFKPSWLSWVWKALAPVGVAALLALLISPNLTPRPVNSVALNSGMEVEADSEDAMIITYRSESEGVSVVWIQTP